MIRRPPRRGLLARLSALVRRPRPAPREAAEATGTVWPVRARPDAIHFFEEYSYKLNFQGHSLYEQQPYKRAGALWLFMPFEHMGPEGRSDAQIGTRYLPGEIEGRIGWLALANLHRSDVATRLASVRPWSEAGRRAFPLQNSLLDERTATIGQQIERGAFQLERLYYTPNEPRPFPLQLTMYLGRDSAVPTEPRPAGAGPAHELGAPSSTTGRELALHVSLRVTLRRPPGTRDEDLDISIFRLHFNWPTNEVASHFELCGTSGRLSTDGRYRQVVIEGVPLRVVSANRGPVVAEANFRLVIRQPARLELGSQQLRGRLKVNVQGMALSGVQAAFFDAAGYRQAENHAGKPLLNYLTELYADFEYWLNKPTAEPPLLLERRYTWPATHGSLTPAREVETVLRERGFALDEGLGTSGESAWRWWGERRVEGLPLIVDARLEKIERPLTVMNPLLGDDTEPLRFGEEPARTFYDLTLHAYYRGPWADVAPHVEWLEERLHQRLHLRRERQ